MLYSDFLKTHIKCPFCEPQTNRSIRKNDKAFLTYALAPYHKHHLLVVPRRHIEGFQDLDPSETESINKLLLYAVELLKVLEYSDYTILMRSGTKSKSVEHLHYHVVPFAMIGDVDHKGEERVIMSDAEVDAVMADIKMAESKI